MQKTARFLAIGMTLGALIGLACASQPEDRPISSVPATTPGAYRKNISLIPIVKLGRTIHAHINKERTRSGLPTMRWDDALARIAAKHSADMSSRKYFSHLSPERQGYAERYFKNNYACGITVDGVLHRGAENIFQFSLVPQNAGYDIKWNRDTPTRKEIAESIIQRWMNSDVDRNNLLSPHWQRQGIGVSIGSDNSIYITVNFC